ncbi:diiron oxygenase [Pseudomonas putida]|uniref:diiron oxygenase n=1 Tax=Pseudomonas putida TaxID=303 RepID=UPI00345DB5A2
MNKLANRSITLFRNWHSSSAVRSRPYAYQFTKADFAQTDPGLWFPIALSPALAHDAIKSLPKKELLIAHASHLVYFMDYTTALEMTHVNEAVRCIVTGSLSKYFENKERRIALKIYADEAYHALFSKDIADHVAQHFNLVRIRPARLDRLDRVIDKSPPALECLTRFCIGFVSETLITHELLKLSSEALVGPVTNMLRDHLHDEGRHAVFFSECFVSLWRNISKMEKDYVAQILPEVLIAFCQPDLSCLRMLLRNRPDLGDEISAYMEANWTIRMIEICGPTLRAIQLTDLLDDEGYFLQFQSAGLIA